MDSLLFSLSQDEKACMIDEKTVKDCWEQNAKTWTELVRSGYDVYRDLLNTPRFLELLPNVKEKLGLDIGCGEGSNTRKLAGLGALMRAIDISSVFIKYSKEIEVKEPKGIDFIVAPAQSLPFPGCSFDFATAFMSMMDMADLESAFEEVFRVLKPGGFFQFSISHPCFDPPFRKKVFDEQGNEVAVQLGGYFDTQPRIFEWQFSSIPKEIRENLPKFQNPYIRRTLSEWFNIIIKSGFVIEMIDEPHPTAEQAKECPAIADTLIVPHFMIIKVRK
jgi:ubiquinone/menaquinone biosynthesis C-methylase UbiE